MAGLIPLLQYTVLCARQVGYNIPRHKFQGLWIWKPQFLSLIDTGAYDLPDLMPQFREIATTLHLELMTVQGKDQYLHSLLRVPGPGSIS